MNPEQMVGPLREYYNNRLAGKTFNAERQFEVAPEQEKIIENNYRLFREALRRMVTLEQRARVDRRVKRPAIELGSICGKLYASIYEKLPTARQNNAIAEMDQAFREASQEFQVNLSGHSAGFKGELAGVILIQKLGLKPIYPEITEDTNMTTDWKAEDRNGRQYLIQVKTYSLTEGQERGGTLPPPIISDVSSKESLDRFRTNMAASILANNDEERERLDEMVGAASVVRTNALTAGLTPIMLVLGSPEAGNSDISTTTSRPTETAFNQAQQEWSEISNTASINA